MRRPPALLAWLLVALLSWQSATAAAHCLGAAAANATLEICGVDGMRQMPLNPDMAPHVESICAVCHVLPAVALPAPDTLPVPVLWGQAAPMALAAVATLRPGARAPPYPPTGPPILL
ncbi:hypothetical protein ACQW02_03290 [Humitalea sp. 24SJ18S-53]|uniref:hypothetical protein n=1 Tax=Humitalea sp. 24SJ18S-53 TaxID=3422307 RepID=UPI003D67E6ED